MSEITNKSFKTVFTEKEIFTEPNRVLHCRGLQEIIVHNEDIGRLLDNLDVRKEKGPDGVSGWALKECKEQRLDPTLKWLQVPTQSQYSREESRLSH
ncbi:hypothetical protein E2C01_045346 [Portunus trituberculatus]|uniref:Uncharacterized protein n=1 Tax=Portunus trituberculatus TaxID=210409 RepID=A0A5B7FUQ9_PORTR|nr:hypothetical protein [Portunus trituberculatus]